jgi:hypothetical protein
MLFVFGGVQPGPRSPTLVALSALGWSAVAALSTWAGFTRARGMLGLPTRWLVAVAGAVVPALFLFAQPFLEPAFVRVSSGAHLVCFALTLAFSGVPLALMVTLQKNTDPVHPVATGATLGAAAGAWGAVLIDLHCPIASASHVLLGHVAPAAVCVLGGGILGWAFVRVRPGRTA